MTKFEKTAPLRKFIPLSELSEENFNEVSENITIENLSAGSYLFKRGDEDQYSYYLLDGTIEISDDTESTTFSSNDEKSYFPLEHEQPRKSSVLCKSNIQYFKIENNLLDILLTWDQNKSYIVNEINSESKDIEDNDWMTKLLQLNIFHKIPPENIQKMFKRMESINVKKGEIIVKQGDKGDYYYIIQSGSCRVLRNAQETGYKDLEIASLATGKGFGEEALVSNEPRNSTIIMNSNGSLIRLAKTDFIELLKKPIIKSVDYNKAKDMISDGAIWLDVRCLKEHRNNNIDNSINIPLFLLRLNSDKLSSKRKYIIYCDTGSRSASATYILNERGYDAYLLDGGLGLASHITN